MTKDQEHEMFRIMMGNQIMILRLLRGLHAAHQGAVDARVRDVKTWWRGEFNEEVGFQTHFGDQPPNG
jgi:hypothetical protein